MGRCERLNGLAMLHIHHNGSVDAEAVFIQQFDMSAYRHRRSALAF